MNNYSVFWTKFTFCWAGLLSNYLGCNMNIQSEFRADPTTPWKSYTHHLKHTLERLTQLAIKIYNSNVESAMHWILHFPPCLWFLVHWYKAFFPCTKPLCTIPGYSWSAYCIQLCKAVFILHRCTHFTVTEQFSAKCSGSTSDYSCSSHVQWYMVFATNINVRCLANGNHSLLHVKDPEPSPHTLALFEEQCSLFGPKPPNEAPKG